jgi:hypothetical protein
MVLAGLGGLALVAVALALLDSGGGGSAKSRAAAVRTHHRGTAAAARRVGGGGTAGASAAPGSPAAAVEAFYGYAASHDYAAAWALADPSFRSQLTGYADFAAQQSAVRQITFQQASTTSTGPGTATVAVQTTPVLSSGTQHCRGTVQVVRGAGGGWLLHQISINCA